MRNLKSAKRNYKSYSFYYQSWTLQDSVRPKSGRLSGSVKIDRCCSSYRVRNENKDERLTILSRESPSGGNNQRWFLQAVALTETSAGCWVPRVRLGGIIPNHLSLGQVDNPFRFSRTLAYSSPPLVSPSWVFIAANRRNMPTRSLRYPPPRRETRRQIKRVQGFFPRSTPFFPSSRWTD